MTRHGTINEYRAGWQSQAACKGQNPADFYTDDARKQRRIAAFCAACPVRADCLDHAIDNDEEHGMRGGLTPRERDRIRPLKPGEDRRACDMCGDLFVTVNPRQKRCGEVKCRNKAERIRQRPHVEREA